MVDVSVSSSEEENQTVYLMGNATKAPLLNVSKKVAHISHHSHLSSISRGILFSLQFIEVKRYKSSLSYK